MIQAYYRALEHTKSREKEGHPILRPPNSGGATLSLYSFLSINSSALHFEKKVERKKLKII
jgi:hypothetical protein